MSADHPLGKHDLFELVNKFASKTYLYLAYQTTQSF